MSKEISSNQVEGTLTKASLKGLRLTDMERSIAEHLMARYGPVLDSDAMAETLRFPSRDALERSLERGHLQIALIKMPNRRGKFALAQSVAGYLVQSVDRDFVDDAEEASLMRKEQPKLAAA